MKIINKRIVLALILVLSLTLVIGGCGSSNTNTGQNNNTGQKDSGKKYVMKFGHIETADSIHQDAALLFKQKVEEATNGNVQVDVYPAAQLGNARSEIEATQTNIQQGLVISSSNLIGFYPPAAITDLPYLFPDRDTTYKITDGPLGEEFLKGYESVGLEGLCFWECGFKQMTGNFPITKPSDYAGKKIRVMESPVLIAQFKSLGASAVPINFGETYNALQQNVVDGEENPLISIYDMKFYEVQDYLTITDHGWLPLVFIVNKQWYDSLPAEYQKAIKQASIEARDSLREALHHEEDEVLIPEMEKAGIKVTELTPEQKEAFAKATHEPTVAALRKMMDANGNAMLDKFLTASEEAKAQK